MSQRHAEWRARAAECHQAALAAMQRAGSITDNAMKAEFLKIATELLKLADDIETFIGGIGEDPIPE